MNVVAVLSLTITTGIGTGIVIRYLAVGVGSLLHLAFSIIRAALGGQ
jgi:hypothetical protein